MFSHHQLLNCKNIPNIAKANTDLFLAAEIFIQILSKTKI